ncbi:MAG: hypothetical protein MSA27_01540 [Spirochaetia bacterium]|nr:hypothetical protein [Spirochaetia bacterium]
MEQKTLYTCKCIDENGKIVRMQIAATDRKNASVQCEEKSLIPIRISQKRKRNPGMSTQILFVQTLEELLRSGLNIEESIGVLSSSGKNNLQIMASRIESSIKKGNSFSQSIIQMS